jgi:hypothetical protein
MDCIKKDILDLNMHILGNISIQEEIIGIKSINLEKIMKRFGSVRNFVSV